MELEYVPFLSLAKTIVDNRGRSCPTSPVGLPLIATNCIRNEHLYPLKEKLRYVAQETYDTWFRGHPEPGDIIFVTKGTPGRVCLTPNPVNFCIAQDMVAVRPDPSRVDPRYLFAILRSSPVQRDIENMHVGTMIPHFKKGDFDKLLLPLPARDVQEQIGEIYHDFSSKIELNRRMNETLEAMARRLFRSWFVDFDPVHAKAALRREHPKLSNADLSRRALPNMAPEVAELFPDSFEDSTLGPIPSGWQCKSLQEIAQVHSGGTPSKSSREYWNGTLPWVSPKAMNSIHVHDSDEHVTVLAVGSGTKQVSTGSVLVMVRGMGLHQGVRISQAQRDVTFNQDVKALVPTAVTPAFLLYAMLDASTYLFSKVQASGHGTGVLPTDILQSLTFSVPPNAHLHQLVEALDSLNGRIAANVREQAHIVQQRDKLLPRLLSGELSLTTEVA